jgi:hypothetical protein
MKITLESRDIKLIKKQFLNKVKNFIKTSPDNYWEVGNTLEIKWEIKVKASWLNN